MGGTPKRTGRSRWTSAALLAAALGCAPAPENHAPGTLLDPEAAAFLEGRNPRRWVRIYDPERAWNGYTLDTWGRYLPILLDMNGTVVHAWPEAQIKSRVRLLPDGSLLAIAREAAVVEYDWDGRLTWRAELAGWVPHHDVIRLANGNTVVLVFAAGMQPISDDILELDRAGEIVWQWSAAERMPEILERGHQGGGQSDLTHFNSVQELPPNRWHTAGDERFRPGNLLVSARNLDAVFVIDRRTGEVVWVYDRDLDLQHEALMIDEGEPGAGHILIFDNRYGSFQGDRRSRIVEIDPARGEVVWSFEADGFYSPTNGVEQPLANGNILVASTRGRRAFELTRGGEIVWQWAPPYEPNRPSRYPYDYAPQLAALPRPAERPVTPDPGYRHVDPPAYHFARRGSVAEVAIDGRKLKVLRRPGACSRVLLPRDGVIWLGFGINRQGARRAGDRDYAATFRLTAARDGEAGPTVVFEERLAVAEDHWREATVALDDWALEWVELCLEIEEAEPGGARHAYWAAPSILLASEVGEAEIEAPAPTAAAAAVQRDHLRALGYVD